MKTLLYVMTQLFICEGKVGTQDITFLDDGNKAGIYKGKLNIEAGARGNNFPVVIFNSNELNFVDSTEECKLTATSTTNGSFTVNAPCTGTGAGTITALNLPTLQLTAESVPVTCRLEQMGQPERRPEPRRQEPSRPQEERRCYGSSYAPSCDDEE